MSSPLTEDTVRAACELNASLANDATVPRSGRLGLDAVLEEIRTAAKRPLDVAVTLSAEAYSSPEVFAWECEHVLAAEWQCVAHVSQFPNNGDFVTLDLLGELLVVVRGKDSIIRVLSRSCPHRGMDIMPPGFGRDGEGPAESRGSGCGRTRLFLCPYHAWTFELDGGLKACPEMHQATGFCRNDWVLASYACEVWNGFVFVNLDGTATKSLAERFTGMNSHIDQWASQDLVIAVERVWDCSFDWKVLVENFMESYRHAGAHRKTLQLLMPARDTWTEEERPHYVRCHLPYRESVREEIRSAEASGGHFGPFPAVAGLGERERNEWGLILGFPTFLVATAPDSLVWYRLQPLGPGRIRLFTTMMVPRATAEHPGFSNWLEAGEDAAVSFHLEDMECCTAVQRSYTGRGYQRGRLSHLEMPIWLLQRYLAARADGTWPAINHPPAPAQQ